MLADRRADRAIRAAWLPFLERGLIPAQIGAMRRAGLWPEHVPLLDDQDLLEVRGVGVHTLAALRRVLPRADRPPGGCA